MGKFREDFKFPMNSFSNFRTGNQTFLFIGMTCSCREFSLQAFAAREKFCYRPPAPGMAQGAKQTYDQLVPRPSKYMRCRFYIKF